MVEPLGLDCVPDVMDTSNTIRESSTSHESCVARRLHPEDIEVGHRVAISELSYQYPTFLWCGADFSTHSPSVPVRISYLPCGEKRPMEVRAVCLPFVLCSEGDGPSLVLDIRQVQLVKVSTAFAEQVDKAFATSSSDKKKNKKKRKKNRKRKN